MSVSHKNVFSIFILQIFLCSALLSQGISQDTPVTREEMLKRAEAKYLKNHHLETKRNFENTIIDDDSSIEGNIVVWQGDLDVYGEVYGDILVMYGNVVVHRHAVVSGNITTVGGQITQHKNSMITGNQIETSERNVFRQAVYYSENRYPHWRESYHNKYSTLPLGKLNDRFIFKYNRVQGPFLGMEFPKSIASKSRILTLHGFVGYGFQEKKLRYQLGLDRYFFNRRDYRFEFGAKIYDLTDTRDEWIITPVENTLSSLIIHQDFQDYYRRQGFELHISQNVGIFVKGTLYFRNDDYSSVQKNTEWAIFGGDKKFRINPEIDEGNMRSLTGELYFDTRNNHEFPRRGWYGKMTMEISNSKLNSDFSFHQYMLELRKYLAVSRAERLDMRFKIGTAENNLPVQKMFELGGLSSLRGFSFKEFVGDRLILANIEYNFSLAAFKRDILFLDDFRLILFSDIGKAWFSKDNANFSNGFEHLTWHSLKSNLGFALTDWQGRIRLNIAKRTDTSRDPWVMTFRIAKPF